MRAPNRWTPIETPDGVFVPGPHGVAAEAMVYPGNSGAVALLENAGEALLLDSGFRAGQQYPRSVLDTITTHVDGRGLDLRYLVVSHWHFDHTGNAQYLADRYDPEVVCHPREREVLEEPLLATRPDYVESLGGDPTEIARDFDLDDPDRLTMDEDTMREHWYFPVEVDRTVTDGDRLRIGETDVTVLHTPGHTPGHLSLYVERTRSLYLQDVMYWPTPQYPHPVGRVDEQLASVERCRDLDADYCFPGHELPRYGREDVADYLADLRLKHVQLADRIRVVLARHDPLTIRDLHGECFPVTDRYSYAADGWHANELNCLQAHLRRLADRGEAERVRRTDGAMAWTVTDEGRPSDDEVGVVGSYGRAATLADVQAEATE